MSVLRHWVEWVPDFLGVRVVSVPPSRSVDVESPSVAPPLETLDNVSDGIYVEGDVKETVTE